MEDASNPITKFLVDENLDGQERVRRLLPLVYEALRAAAAQRLIAERAGHTLSATALVHEAYLKLIGPRKVPWASRAHFYVAAADAMRQILLDHARSKHRIKRGGSRKRVDLDALASLADDPATETVDFVTLNEAICRLKEKDPRAAAVVHLRYFAGLSVADTSAALDVSEKTVKNDWAFAKSWLQRELDRTEH